MSRQPSIGLKRPRNHNWRGRLWSLDDVCRNCGQTLGNHAGGDPGWCPRTMGYPYNWDKDHYFEMWPEHVQTPEGL